MAMPCSRFLAPFVAGVGVVSVSFAIVEAVDSPSVYLLAVYPVAMMARPRYLAAFAAGIGIVGAGYAIMKAVTPTADQLYRSLSPELKRQVDEQRREFGEKGQKELVDMIKKASESTKPVWEEMKGDLRDLPREKK